MHLPPQPTLLILIRSYEPRVLIPRRTVPAALASRLSIVGGVAPRGTRCLFLRCTVWCSLSGSGGCRRGRRSIETQPAAVALRDTLPPSIAGTVRIWPALPDWAAASLNH
jgi:hypothetical protein